jgi:pilus assembly protein Flp/PilA
VSEFSANARGATAIEYALIAGFVSIVIVGAVGAVGTDVLALFTRLADKMP